jgi:hypothetical protein
MARRLNDKIVAKQAVAVSAGINAGIPIVGTKIDGTGFSRARFIFNFTNAATTASLVAGLGVWQASTSGAAFAQVAGASAAAVTSGVISGGANNIIVIDVPVASATPWLQLSGSFGQTGAAHAATVELYSGINIPPTQAEQQVIVV